jgi:Asp-tRNA(Asn)/Glu-tRNA(Gln) amidotransferase B subunit
MHAFNYHRPASTKDALALSNKEEARYLAGGQSLVQAMKLRLSSPTDLIDLGTINDKLARDVFDGVLAGEGSPEEVVAARGLEVVSDDGALSAAVDRAVEANPAVADKIREGKVAAAGALIGAVMKEMRGQADAARVRELILEKLGQ